MHEVVCFLMSVWKYKETNSKTLWSYRQTNCCFANKTKSSPWIRFIQYALDMLVTLQLMSSMLSWSSMQNLSWRTKKLLMEKGRRHPQQKAAFNCVQRQTAFHEWFLFETCEAWWTCWTWSWKQRAISTFSQTLYRLTGKGRSQKAEKLNGFLVKVKL